MGLTKFKKNPILTNYINHRFLLTAKLFTWERWNQFFAIFSPSASGSSWTRTCDLGMTIRVPSPCAIIAGYAGLFNFLDGATTLSITTFSIIINKLRHSAQRHSAWWQSVDILSVIMKNATYKPFMLSVIMLNVSYKPYMLSVNIPSVVILNVVMQSVAAPLRYIH